MTKLTLVDIFTDNVVKKPKIVSNEIRQLAREDLQIAILKSNRDLRSKYEMPKTCLKNIDEIRFLVMNTEESIFSENGRDYEKYIESILTYILFLSDKNLSLDSIIFRFLINIDINDMYISPDCAEILFADLIYSTCSYTEKFKCINQVITEIKNRVPFIENDYSNGKRYSDTKTINYSLNPKTRTSMSQYREGQLDSIFQVLLNKGDFKPIDWNESIVSLASLFEEKEEDESESKESESKIPEETKDEKEEKAPSIIAEIDKMLETDKKEKQVPITLTDTLKEEKKVEETESKSIVPSIISEIDSLVGSQESNESKKDDKTNNTNKTNITPTLSTNSSLNLPQLFDDDSESIYSFTTDDSVSSTEIKSNTSKTSNTSKNSKNSIKTLMTTTPKPLETQTIDTKKDTESETDIETEIETDSEENRSAVKTIYNSPIQPDKKEAYYSDSNTDDSSLYSSFSEQEESETENEEINDSYSTASSSASLKTASTKNQELVNKIKQLQAKTKTSPISSKKSISSHSSINSIPQKSSVNSSACKKCKSSVNDINYKTIVYKTNPSQVIFCSNKCMTDWEP